MEQGEAFGALACAQVCAVQALGDAGFVRHACARLGQEGDSSFGVVQPVVVDFGGFEQKFTALCRIGGGGSERGQLLRERAVLTAGKQDAPNLRARGGIARIHAMGFAPGSGALG